MKKFFFVLVSFVLIQSFAHAQVNIRNNAAAGKINEVKTVVVKPAAFRIHVPNQTLFFTSTKPNVIDMPVKEFDLGGNVTGNNFKAFEAGVYHFDASLSVNCNMEENVNIHRLHLYMFRNGGLIDMHSIMNPKQSVSTEFTLSVSTTVMLQKGDVISLSYEVDTDAGHDSMTRSIDGSFSGFKVYTGEQQ